VEKRIKILEDKIKSMEFDNERLKAVNEIQNLMGKYEYLHSAGLHEETAALFAQKTPGVRSEAGPLGVYEGAEGIRKLYVGFHKFEEGDRLGRMAIHTLTTPVIEVAGDGKTAKGVWISPGLGTTKHEGKLQAEWAWVKYGVDFVKEDGKWKFWHLHGYGVFFTPYEKSWVHIPDTSPVTPMPDELKADKPSTYHHPYSTTTAHEYVPAPPEPYETFDERTAY
jgi:hypothetical protein